MRIKVYAPAEADDRLIDDQHYLTVDEGTSVADLLKKLKLNILHRTIVPVSVNHKSVKKSHILHEGDVVSIYQVQSGG